MKPHRIFAPQTADAATTASMRKPPSIMLRPSAKSRIALPEATHVVSVADMPAYHEDLRASADAAVAALPRDRCLFTYADIAQWLGISRATVLRRVRGGLVPGIRFQNDRVIEEGAVRRFTREQLRYIVLAAKCRIKTTRS
jgi:hypothetical protein